MLLLVRHGETLANRRRLFSGRSNSPLTADGRRQIAELVKVLPTPDVVISSPLQRARETAAAFDRDFDIDERWVELDYGPFDLTPVEQVPRDVLDEWRQDPDRAPPGVEALSSVWSRAFEACNEIERDHHDSVVIVVTHVNLIKAAIGWLWAAFPPRWRTICSSRTGA